MHPAQPTISAYKPTGFALKRDMRVHQERGLAYQALAKSLSRIKSSKACQIKQQIPAKCLSIAEVIHRKTQRIPGEKRFSYWYSCAAEDLGATTVLLNVKTATQ